MYTVDLVPSLQGRVASHGRLNIGRALDNISPAAVNDLSVESVGKTSIAVSWTAPGDNGQSGTAQFFDLRYATFPLTEYNFLGGTQVSTEPPGEAGTNHCIEIENLNSCTQYYFALKTSDDAFNTSAIGNVASGTTKCSGSSIATCPGGFQPALEGGTLLATNTVTTSLGSAAPNPGRQTIKIPFTLSSSALVQLRIYDVSGRPVKTLVQETRAPGNHVVLWDGVDGDAGRMAPGVYFYRMTVGGWVSQRKIVIIGR